MKTTFTLLLLAGALSAAHTAHADTTRAQVLADLQAFKAAGVDPYAKSYNPLAAFRSQRSRAEVQAEFLAGRDGVRTATSEAGTPVAALVQPQAGRTRAEVTAEYLANREATRAATSEDGGATAAARGLPAPSVATVTGTVAAH